jgi:hypothetical protein
LTKARLELASLRTVAVGRVEPFEPAACELGCLVQVLPRALLAELRVLLCERRRDRRRTLGIGVARDDLDDARVRLNLGGDLVAEIVDRDVEAEPRAHALSDRLDRDEPHFRIDLALGVGRAEVRARIEEGLDRVALAEHDRRRSVVLLGGAQGEDERDAHDHADHRGNQRQSPTQRLQIGPNARGCRVVRSRLGDVGSLGRACVR